MLPPDWTSLPDSTLDSLLDNLSPQQIATLRETIRTSLPWAPNPGPQAEAYLSHADELYYGGAAGGGKSQLLVGLSLTQHLDSLILRRRAVDAKSLSKSIKGLSYGSWKYAGSGGELRTPDGRLVEVGGCEHEDDKQKYQGNPHDLKCVGRGTPVRLASGKYRPIEEMRPGDLVTTLDGPRRVIRAIRMGVRPSVRITVRCGQVAHSQVQSRNHQILTDSGWISRDTFGGVRPFAFFAPKRLPGGGRCGESSLRRCGVFSPFASGSRAGLRRPGESRQCPVGCRCESGLPAGTGRLKRGTDCAVSCGNTSGISRRVLFHLAHAERFRLVSPSVAVSSPPPFCGRDIGDASAETSRSSCLDDCWCGIRLHGEHLPLKPIAARVLPQQRGGVEGPTPTDFEGGDPAGTPTHTRCTPSYNHPYTQETRRTPAGMSIASAAWALTEPCEVFDLTVEDANHYLTGSIGVVNRNCFDELPQFTESQYTFIIGWNRPANPRLHPHQRCRVIGAGNPPTDPEGEWVLRRWRAWLDPTAGQLVPPGELRWYTTIAGDEIECPDARPVTHKKATYLPRSRTFIPARLEDNPDLMRTGYAATLEAMPEPLRSMLRYGDMLAARVDDRWQLIPTRWVVEGQRRWAARSKSLGPLNQLGVDVAMGGDDQTVIAPRHGKTIGSLAVRKAKDTPDGQSVTAMILAAGGGSAEVVTNIDAIGIGKSAFDIAKMSGVGHPKAVIVSNATGYVDPRVPKLKFGNIRAAMMWKVRAMLDPEGGPDETRLAIPPDRELLADLTAPRYGLRAAGVYVESKDDIRERIGRSTDKGDAVALACWERAGLAIV